MDKEQSHGNGKIQRAEEESIEGASTSSFISPVPMDVDRGQYDVFLSFRGSDTRKAFTDHLYHSLIKVGTVPICVFRDDNSIPIGEEFGSQILDAIARSKISIPVISENYASSKWCLRELIHIMDRKKSTSHIVLPIFYKVDPSDVRYLKGSFGEAFHSHKKHFDEKDIQEGQQALREVSDLHGWESEKVANGHEGELVEKVKKKVLSELRQDFQLDVTEHLLGIGDHVNKIKNWADTRTTNTRMIGIYGMGGIGKTTLAKVIYNRLSNDFVHRSFLADIRETACHNRIPYLQKQLIKEILQIEPEVWNVDHGINIIKSRLSKTKVLILLDDIDHKNQLDALARKRNWFMAGSMIIVTTRYEAVLDQSEFKVDYKYEMYGLDEVQALLLFNRHAFRKDHSPRDFEGISRDIVSTMGGLPLALVVIGSYLYEKTNQEVWKDVRKQLRSQPYKDVQKILQISYDALEDGHKQIFLDIVCFFIGKKSKVHKFAMYMWEDCGFYPSQGIDELKLRCLIKIRDDGAFMVHDQLRDLGRSIFCQGQPLGKCSGPWDCNYRGASRVVWEETRPLFFGDWMWPASSEDSSWMRAALSGDSSNELLSEVRWLKWRAQGSSSHIKRRLQRICIRICQCCVLGDDPPLPSTNLDLPKLSVLDLSDSDITGDWEGWSLIKTAKRLQVLHLSCCYGLGRIPDLSAFTQLKILILNHCFKLEHLHPSVGKLTSLVSLDLRWCGSLKGLPEEVGKLKDLEELLLDVTGITEIPTSVGSLRKLKKLSVGYCKSLREIPSSIGDLQNLQHLNLYGCESLKELPEEVGELKDLEKLPLGCSGITEIPTSIGSLRKLKKLSARFCESLREIPSSIGDLQNLQFLYVNYSGIEKLPSAIGRLKNLRTLKLKRCDSLKGAIPSEIGDLSSLEILDIIGTPISDLPESIQNLSSLQHLCLSGCDKLRSLPQLPLGLTDLSVSCQSPRLPQLSSLIHLEELRLWSCHLLEDIPELPSRLLKLRVRECGKLILLKLDRCEYLEDLLIKGCSSIERLDLSQLIRLKRLHAEHCDSLVEIQGYDNLEFLEGIFIYDCNSIKRLLCPKSRCLKKLAAVKCNNLVEIRGLDDVKFLEELDFTGCESMEMLPNLTGCEKLRSLNVRNCKKLTQLGGFEKLDLIDLDIFGCDSLEAIPKLSRTRVFRNYTNSSSDDSSTESD